MPDNEEAHMALTRVGVKKGPLPLRVLEAVGIIESQRVRIRSLEGELDKKIRGY